MAAWALLAFVAACFGVVNTALTLVAAQWLGWPWAVFVVTPVTWWLGAVVVAKAAEE